VMPVCAAGVALLGVAVGGGLLVAAGVVPVAMKGLRIMPELAPWSALGVLPLVAAIMLARGRREWGLGGVAAAAVLFVGLTAAFPVLVFDAYKAPKALVAESGARRLTDDIRLASLDYTQPSVTFYAGRRVQRMPHALAAAEFLGTPRPAYLFVPEAVYDTQLANRPLPPHTIAARKFDAYRNGVILVVANAAAQSPPQGQP
jgi:hypothetical protein